MTGRPDAFATNIISATDALSEQSSGRHVVFLDVRFSPKQQDFRSDYDNEHISGAHHVDLKTQLQGKGGGVNGSRPLPEIADLQRNVTQWGIRPETLVVAYSDRTPAAAARAWFVLQWAGLPDVRYLDGGLAAWKAAGGKTDGELPPEVPGTFTIAQAGGLPTLSADDVAGYIRAGGPVFDARGGAEYAGDGSPRSGHIPGARSLPSSTLLDAGGLVLKPNEVRAVLDARGADGADYIGVYCGGGVGGALETLALRSAGIDARLFVGSFSAWSADPDRAVAHGSN
ncbi:rhodanese-like domain-containing protein [Rhizobium sp. S163]|uniref:sulfurtransferase n=1 Tax=Rhizobium sp. S163 TaxID=3055039 RepID=UPI0025A936F4|nr:rhodanese-like domain-containing protein [Rhizobium sp. S163]MDM9644039.1 rhodanese-like domain-containing protein [Rhizobium sp. S163]